MSNNEIPLENIKEETEEEKPQQETYVNSKKKRKIIGVNDNKKWNYRSRSRRFGLRPNFSKTRKYLSGKIGEARQYLTGKSGEVRQYLSDKSGEAQQYFGDKFNQITSKISSIHPVQIKEEIKNKIPNMDMTRLNNIASNAQEMVSIPLKGANKQMHIIRKYIDDKYVDIMYDDNLNEVGSVVAQSGESLDKAVKNIGFWNNLGSGISSIGSGTSSVLASIFSAVLDGGRKTRKKRKNKYRKTKKRKKRRRTRRKIKKRRRKSKRKKR
tara:strand:- start:52 stop:855 length:804 start_codon:yes stop_codon:yes gene_type:complete